MVWHFCFRVQVKVICWILWLQGMKVFEFCRLGISHIVKLVLSFFLFLGLSSSQFGVRLKSHSVHHFRLSRPCKGGLRHLFLLVSRFIVGLIYFFVFLNRRFRPIALTSFSRLFSIRSLTFSLLMLEKLQVSFVIANILARLKHVVFWGVLWFKWYELSRFWLLLKFYICQLLRFTTYFIHVKILRNVQVYMNIVLLILNSVVPLS